MFGILSISKTEAILSNSGRLLNMSMSGNLFKRFLNSGIKSLKSKSFRKFGNSSLNSSIDKFPRSGISGSLNSGRLNSGNFATVFETLIVLS